MATLLISGKEISADLVIFDKDGTLIDFKETWVTIIDSLITAMGRHVPLTQELKVRVQKVLGLSVEKREIDGDGPLAMGTFTECDALLTYCLYREGTRWDNAQAIVQSLGNEIFRSDVRKKSIRPAKGAIDLLARLKKRGFQRLLQRMTKRMTPEWMWISSVQGNISIWLSEPTV